MLGVQMQLHTYVYGIFYHVTISFKVRFILKCWKTITVISIFHSILFPFLFILYVRCVLNQKNSHKSLKEGWTDMKLGKLIIKYAIWNEPFGITRSIHGFNPLTALKKPFIFHSHYSTNSNKKGEILRVRHKTCNNWRGVKLYWPCKTGFMIFLIMNETKFIYEEKFLFVFYNEP